MTRGAGIEQLARVAEDQWGLVTRQQAVDLGIPVATLTRMTSPGGPLNRVAHGVYQLRGAPAADHVGLRAAWLQLAPGTYAWQREAAQGVVSHRSAAALYRLGHLSADRHEFTLARRHQSRRSDVRLHGRALEGDEVARLTGLPITRPARIAADLLSDSEEPDAVAQVIAEAMHRDLERPPAFADAIARYAGRFGLRRHDGQALLQWLLDLVGDPALADRVDYGAAG